MVSFMFFMECQQMVEWQNAQTQDVNQQQKATAVQGQDVNTTENQTTHTKQKQNKKRWLIKRSEDKWNELRRQILIIYCWKRHE